MVNRKESLEKPDLRDIRIEDLRRLSRLKALYAQAVSQKWLAHSEANLRNFITAAARATRVDGDASEFLSGSCAGDYGTT
jgi:hypothetical protein